MLSLPNNDYSWSSWEDDADALEEIDEILTRLESGDDPASISMSVLFAPTGPMQEVSLSSGWGDQFVELAERFDRAMAAKACACPNAVPEQLTEIQNLGVGEHFAEFSLLQCGRCGQTWLMLRFENEGISRSGRWYLGAVDPSLIADMTPQNAKSVLESLPVYFCGGSYFDGVIGQSSGSILL